MSTTIRLTRMGRKQRPFYRLIVTDSRNRRDGAYLANLGFYNPFADPLEVKLHEQEIIAWLRKGATVSETARSLMRREGVLLRWELLRQGLSA
ncbi:30S ribosomal protein S16, partial [bacterium]|nr:30S ribosomal protein S16 [bacterium]